MPFSANPMTCPRLLMPYAWELCPPGRFRSAVIFPFFQMAARHCRWVPNPQKSSPFGSLSAVSERSADSPSALGPPASLLHKGHAEPPRVPRFFILPLYQRNAVWASPLVWLSVAAPPETTPASLIP